VAAGTIVDCERNRARVRLQAAERAVAVPRLDGFVEKFIEPIDAHQPTLVLPVERVEKPLPFLTCNLAPFHAVSPFVI
jgi:hypothetical protein